MEFIIPPPEIHIWLMDCRSRLPITEELLNTTSSVARAARVVVAISLSAGALVSASNASAQEPDRPLSHRVAVIGGPSGEAAKALADRLGESHTGGVYLDRAEGRFVVNVTDDEAAKSVQDAGVVARNVVYDTAYLDSIKRKLDVTFSTPGTSWGVNVQENKVLVRAYDTVGEAEYSALSQFIKPYGDAARIMRLPGEIGAAAGAANGGDYIANGRISCSYGFSVRKKDAPTVRGFLTAGHCTSDVNNRWVNSTGNLLGHTTGHNYSYGNDFGLVNSGNPDITYVGNVDAGGEIQDIVYSRDSWAGEYVCTSGYKSRHACGIVDEKNVTVTYTSGHTVSGMDQTNICRINGDSGGPLFSGVNALGILSGITTQGGCASWYQPANEALAWYGVEVF